MKDRDLLVLLAFGGVAAWLWYRSRAAAPLAPLPSYTLPVSQYPIFTGPSVGPPPVPKVEDQILYQNPETGVWEPVVSLSRSSAPPIVSTMPVKEGSAVCNPDPRLRFIQSPCRYSEIARATMSGGSPFLT